MCDFSEQEYAEYQLWVEAALAEKASRRVRVRASRPPIAEAIVPPVADEIAA